MTTVGSMAFPTAGSIGFVVGGIGVSSGARPELRDGWRDDSVPSFGVLSTRQDTTPRDSHHRTTLLLAAHPPPHITPPST